MKALNHFFKRIVSVYGITFIAILGFFLYPITGSAQLLPEHFHSTTEQFGVNWSLNYNSEIMSNLAGGSQTKTAYQGYLDLGMSIDLEKILGLDQTTINF